MNERVRIRLPHGAPGVTLRAQPAGTSGSLAERLARVGQTLNTRCAHRGICAGCTVRLQSGIFRERGGREIAGPAEVRACQGDVDGAGEVEVPARSLVAHRPQVVSSFKVGVAAAHQPLVEPVLGWADHGLAIDIGTTTVVVALVDLMSGRIVREESAFNRQIEFGDDVVTRIHLAGDPAQREALRVAIVERTLALLIRDACARSGVVSQRIAVATVAANTTMLHLLTGTDPTPMGVAPFRAPFTAHRQMTAAELGLRILPAAVPVHLLPSFGAFVGADLVAGCVCTGLLEGPGPHLLIDIGTNGEILLWSRGRLYATSTAAGPAFEGGRLTRGVHAVPGAIAHVEFPAGEFEPRLELVAGAAQPIGLCGSAYVDFLAEARRIGLLLPNGRLSPETWGHLPRGYRCENGDGRGVYLRGGDGTTTVMETDIAHLLQAKAAMAAGLVTLLRRADLQPAQIARVYLAGGFGLHLEVRRAIACGLLPGLEPRQVEVVGNTALGGAWLALIDRSVLPEMTEASQRAELVELNLDPGFEDTFIDQLLLP